MSNDTTPCDQPAAHPHTCDCTPSPPVPDPTPFRLLRNGPAGDLSSAELDAQWQEMHRRISAEMGSEFATALDFNIGARMAHATRPLLRGLEAAEALIGATLEGMR